MASGSGDHERQSREGRERARERGREEGETGPFSLEGLGTVIRRLTVRRQAAFDQARAYRRNGQLVPGSLREEIADNGNQLRDALKRYTDATQ
jgi:hypothetical protein